MLSSSTVFRRLSLAAFLLLVTCFVVNGQTYYNPGTGWAPVGQAPVDIRWSGPNVYRQVADTARWTGVYVDKKLLKGQAYFQLGIQRSGNAIQIVFNAAYNDGHGPAPEAHGAAKITGKDTLEFQFVDSLRNSGSGTIKRAGNDIIVDFIFASAVDKSCLDFYGRNMHLSRAGKK